MEPKEKEKVKLLNYAKSVLSDHSHDFERDVRIAQRMGIDVLKNGGSLEDAYSEMNLYLSTID